MNLDNFASLSVYYVYIGASENKLLAQDKNKTIPLVLLLGFTISLPSTLSQAPFFFSSIKYLMLAFSKAWSVPFYFPLYIICLSGLHHFKSL